MNTFEKCEKIQRMLINRAAEVMTYTNWSDEFAVKQIREIPGLLLNMNRELGNIQLDDLTSDQRDRLGFRLWSNDNPIRLIQLWLLPFLADNIKATRIDGRSIISKAEMDNDNRFGCLAYGIIPSK